MSTNQNTSVNSNAELEKLSTGNIGVIAEYAFSNPNSINGPFGTMKLTITDKVSGKGNAIGEIKINTLFGLGSVTDLRFISNADFNGSTGYTTINTEGHGTIVVRPNPPKHITAKINISLQPGFEEGTLSIQGFFTDFHIKATLVHYIKG